MWYKNTWSFWNFPYLAEILIHLEDKYSIESNLDEDHICCHVKIHDDIASILLSLVEDTYSS